MTQPTQDLRVGVPIPANTTLNPFVIATPLPPAAASPGYYPADDDPLFPYKPRALHATGFQYDLLSLRPLAADYAAGVLDELGTPLRDEYGAPLV